MNTKLSVISLFFLISLLSTKAISNDDIQYNYVEFRFVVDANLDDVDVDGDGFAFAGSYRLDELFYLIADYEDLDFNRGVDSTVIKVGGGVIVPYQNIGTSD